MFLWVLLTAAWATTHSLLHGFHISGLNGIQDAVTCTKEGEKYGMKDCIDLNSAQFGVVVTIYTLGGLIGSLGVDQVTRRCGRVGTLRVAEIAFLLGTAAVGLANTMWLMLIGRIAIGLGSGLSMVTVPLLLSETFSQRYKPASGPLHQTAIGVGMVVAQSLSIPFAKPWIWRLVLFVGFAIALLAFLVSWAIRPPGEEGQADEETPLVEGDKEDSLSVQQLWSSSKIIKRGVLIVAVAQFAQQICGMSPVMYFSTRILSPLFQGNSQAVALAFIAAGIPFNFVPALLPKSIGSRRLLLISSFGTGLSALVLAFGLNYYQRIISATAIILFVLLFSMGLAPVAWVVLSEVVPRPARTAAGSIGVSVNWITNFVGGSIFLPLQELLKGGDHGEGNVFFVYASFSAIAFAAIFLSYRWYHQAKADEREED